MGSRQSRTLVGLTGLVVLWIVVYWAWQPRSEREPVLTFPSPLAGVEHADDSPGPGAGEESLPTRVPEPVVHPVAPGGDGSEFGEPPIRLVTVRDGDTFERIAERELGSKTLWTAIARANPFKDPNRLRAGDQVKIPLDPGNPQGKPPPEAQRAPEPPPVVEYTVRSGDTLSGIAQQFYGSVRYVDLIYESNRDRLRNRDDLRLGQVLRLPPKPTGGE